VLSVASGGRHSMVLALPDNSDSDRAARLRTSVEVLARPLTLMKKDTSAHLCER
jgi:hypothetical protein